MVRDYRQGGTQAMGFMSNPKEPQSGLPLSSLGLVNFLQSGEYFALNDNRWGS